MSLFKLQDTNQHQSHVVYHAKCSCGETYIGETMRNLDVRKSEHENISHNSEPARHLAKNPTHSLQWKILRKETFIFKRRIIEGLLISQQKPSLNKQVHCYVAKLFPSGIS